MSNIPDSFITPSTKPLILCFVPHYLPEIVLAALFVLFQTWSIVLAMIMILRFLLLIDYLASEPYSNININSWNTVGKATDVLFLS